MPAERRHSAVWVTLCRIPDLCAKRCLFRIPQLHRNQRRSQVTRQLSVIHCMTGQAVSLVPCHCELLAFFQAIFITLICFASDGQQANQGSEEDNRSHNDRRSNEWPRRLNSISSTNAAVLTDHEFDHLIMNISISKYDARINPIIPISPTGKKALPRMVILTRGFARSTMPLTWSGTMRSRVQ